MVFRSATLAAVVVVLVDMGSAGLLTDASAGPIEVLDRQLTGPATGDYGFDGARSIAQTFAVGVAGTLSRIEIRATEAGDPWNDGDLVLSVYDTVNSTPRNSLVDVVIPESTFPGIGQFIWVDCDVSSSGIQVASGEQLAIVATSSDARHYAWASTLNGPGGAEHRGSFNGNVWEPVNPDLDMLFRTYVTVPEPSTILLLATGAVGLLACGRRKSRP